MVIFHRGLMRQHPTPTELGEKVLKTPFNHDTFVDAEVAIRELIKEVENLTVVLRGRTDVVAEWMEKYQQEHDFVVKLREENAYVNDMLENAHNRSRILEAKLKSLGAEI